MGGQFRDAKRRDNHPFQFTLQPLESRRYFSASLINSADTGSVQSAPIISMAAQVDPAGAAVSVADRRALISEFSGPLAASLAKTLRHSGADAFDATLLKYMTHRPGPIFFYNPKHTNRLLDYIDTTLAVKIAPEVQQADEILAHKFPEQINSQSNDVQLGPEIDWDVQPKRVSNPDFLHSLNRHTFWKDLATAYTLTGDGKYVTELAAQLASWSQQTPPLQNPDDWAASSPHWWLLDAADRASNWTSAYFMVLGSPDWTAAANTLFMKEIWLHGDFLSRVTPGSFKSNKTAIHAAGLLRIGLLFPEFSAAAKWEEQGFDMTFRALATQFYPDGGHVEETPAYQASALNAFLENYRLAELNGRSNWTRNRRHLFLNAVEALYQLLTPSGTMPGISDTYRTSTPGPFLTRCGLLLGDTRYVIARPTLDDVFLVGPDRLREVFVGSPGTLYNRGPSYALPDAGYYMLRDSYEQSSQNSPLYFSNTQVLFDAGPKGGTHGHYDLLSFDLETPLFNLVADPGPYEYDDSADRKYVISTPAHNTISIDGLNHEAVEGKNNPKIVVDDFTTTPTEGRVTAHHHAYEYLDGKPTVGRTIWMDRTMSQPPLIIAVDWARSDAPHTFTTSFNFPQTDVTETAPGVVDIKLTRTYRMRAQSLLLPGQTDALNATFVSNSPPPDAKTPATRYAVSQTGNMALFVTMFSEYIPTGFNPTQPASIAFASPPQPGQAVHLSVTMANGTTRSLVFQPPDLSPLPS